jgi:hypothetical protein
VIAMVEGIIPERGSRRLPLDTVRRFADLAHAADLHVTACAFPDVREKHDPSILNLLDCREEGADALELDAEPRAKQYWTPYALRPWLDAIPDLSITTTRHEATRLGRADRRLRLQLEQLTSTDTLEHALTRGERLTTRDQIEPVIGVFDQRGIGRTPDMVRRDLERCTPQARLAGGLAAWSAHTLDDDEADVLREWAIATWAPRAA